MSHLAAGRHVNRPARDVARVHATPTAPRKPVRHPARTLFGGAVIGVAVSSLVAVLVFAGASVGTVIAPIMLAAL